MSLETFVNSLLRPGPVAITYLIAGVLIGLWMSRNVKLPKAAKLRLSPGKVIAIAFLLVIAYLAWTGRLG